MKSITVKELAKAFAVPPQNDADRARLLKVASACMAWETTTSRSPVRLSRAGASATTRSRPPKERLGCARMSPEPRVEAGLSAG
jgi:hypothetical protein